MANVSEQLKKALADLKAHWDGLDAKKKKLLLILVGGLLALAISVTLFLNLNTSGYTVLYEGMEKPQAAEVFSALQELDVPITARMNNTGNVEVMKKDKDKALMELAIKGIPSADLPNGIYSGTGGLTTTDLDKRQLIAQQLQNRLQATFRQMEGIKNAIVNLNISQETNRVWETQKGKSTAGVMLTMEPGVTLSKDQVYGIKHLVAKSVGSSMNIDDVAVIDSATGLSLKSRDQTDTTIDSELERLGYSKTIEQSYVDKVLNVIGLFVNPEDVRVSATIKLDYNKMKTESTQYTPSQDSNNNSGVVQNRDESYIMGAGDVAGGIAGEEDNTDAPVGYVDNNGDGVADAADYQSSTQYVVDTVLKQIEKGAVEILSEESTIAITLKGDIDSVTMDSIIASAAKATALPEANISVQNFVPPPKEDVPTGNGLLLEGTTLWIVIGAAAGVLLLMLILILVIGKKKKKKIKKEKEAQAAAGTLLQKAVETDPAFAGITSQQELEARKRQIQDAAERSKNDNAIAEEVREFAKANPQITANLLRTWLKEDDDE